MASSFYAGGQVSAGHRLGELLAGGAAGREVTRRFDPGEVIFHQGDEAASVYVVVEGRAAVRLLTEAGNRVTVAVVGPGEVLGELALLQPGARRGATVEAIDEVRTTVVDRPTFEDLRSRDPALTDLLIDMLADRVRELDEQLVEALYIPVEVRVVRRLIALTELYGSTVPLRQEDLAGMAGTTRTTVNRVLRRFAGSGLVSLHRGRIHVVDPDGLQRAARGARRRA